MRPIDPMVQAESLLGRIYGHAGFRGHQGEVVRAMSAGRDVLAVLPTGAGKSVCFQVPALLQSGPTLVVSPLISLMQDQVQGLVRRGVPAAALTSASSRSERNTVADALRRGSLRLLYVSPERLASPSFISLIRSIRLARVVVDEAHCISEWGHDFRPDYLRIGVFVRACSRAGDPRIPVAAFTATATAATRGEISRRLGLVRPLVAVASVDRTNLYWEAWRAPTTCTAVRRVVSAAGRIEGQAIIYVRSRWATVRLAEACVRTGLSAAPYHAGLPADARAAIQDRFLAGRYGLLCATSAFGMGIDHPAVRAVLHLGMPESLEAYVQQAGRAGRDGRPASAVLVWTSADVPGHRRRIRDRWPLVVRGLGPRAATSAHRQRRRAATRLRAMAKYAAGLTCRRALITSYFGERLESCAGCDRCRRPGPPLR